MLVSISDARSNSRVGVRRCAYLSLGLRHPPAKLELRRYVGGRDVDLALRLNVLAVFAVFAFVGAILLGAF